MLRQSAAIVLIVLGLLPFTAPFPTCDIADQQGNGSPRHAPTTSLADPSALRVVSIALSMGRPRLAALSGIHLASTSPARPAGAARTVAGERWIARHSTLLTILRI